MNFSQCSSFKSIESKQKLKANHNICICIYVCVKGKGLVLARGLDPTGTWGMGHGAWGLGFEDDVAWMQSTLYQVKERFVEDSETAKLVIRNRIENMGEIRFLRRQGRRRGDGCVCLELVFISFFSPIFSLFLLGRWRGIKENIGHLHGFV